jgi:molybdenum cofactor biosynthesis enzyme MoaA
MLFGKKNILSSTKSDKISDYVQFKKKKHLSGRLCQAPFTSLRFTISGNVQACCYNRLLLLGKYPNNNLVDIWNGFNIKSLRESISVNDLSRGCGYCNEGIKTGNYYSIGAANYDYLKPTKINWPVMLDFELGNNCNLECIMCNGENSALIRKNRENEEPFLPPYDDEFVEQLESFIPHLSEARFVGGEPFLIEINYKIWEKIIEINPKCKIIVLTNSTILTDRIKLLLNKGNFNISISSDGISSEVYEKIRINADFLKFIENQNYFLQYSQTRNNSFFWNFCPQRLNWHEIPDFFAFCNKKNINIILHTIFFPPHTALWNLSRNELETIKTTITQNQPVFSKNNIVHKQNKEVFDSFCLQIENWIDNSKTIESSENINNEDLKSELYSKISIYISESKVFTESHKTELFELYKGKLDKIFELLDNKSLNKVLKFLISFNIELTIAEIENSSEDKLKQRILTAAK